MNLNYFFKRRNGYEYPVMSRHDCRELIKHIMRTAFSIEPRMFETRRSMIARMAEKDPTRVYIREFQSNARFWQE
jgi:hypothetical protein